jgi:DNA polymerase-3 subunit alpha
MIYLEKKGEYAVMLEPEAMSVSADKAWIEGMEAIVGKGCVQALG